MTHVFETNYRFIYYIVECKEGQNYAVVLTRSKDNEHYLSLGAHPFKIDKTEKEMIDIWSKGDNIKYLKSLP